ncbi:MAG: signal peptidase II [Pseudomonadota bacterium]
MHLLYATAFLAFAVDQLSKLGVVFGLALIRYQSIDVWPPFLNLRMGWNRGVNFGLLGTAPDMMRWVLILIAVIVSGWLIWWARRSFNRRTQYLAAGLIIGGALGNALDRVLYGAVADFLNVSCCGIQNPYTFNVADIFIFAGAIALLVLPVDDKTP